MNNREQRNYVSHACLINRKQARICSVNGCETRISWGNKRKKQWRPRWAEYGFQINPSQASLQFSRAMPSLDVLRPLYQLLHLAAQSPQPPFPKSSWSAVPVAMPASGQRCCWEGEKCIAAIILKGYSCQTHCVCGNTCWVAVAVGRARWRKTAVKVPAAVGSSAKTALCQFRDVPNYLAAFQISGCPLHLPAYAPWEYFSINTTTATLPLLSHFNFSLYFSVLLLFLAPSSVKESPVLQCRAQNKGWDLQLVGRQSTAVKVFGNWLLRSAGLLFCVSPVVVVVVGFFPRE